MQLFQILLLALLCSLSIFMHILACALWQNWFPAITCAPPLLVPRVPLTHHLHRAASSVKSAPRCRRHPVPEPLWCPPPPTWRMSPPSSGARMALLAKVLGEAGHHDEAVDATVRACRIQPTFHNHYQHAEALLSAKRHAEAQGAYRSLVARRDP